MSRHSLIARAAPARGQVITSKEADAATLLVVSHLRAPNCADGAPAYPCPQGVEENRNDHGMGYLGQALAAAGYTVIVPDLGGLLIGADTATPYDQNLMWRYVVGRFVQTLTAPTAAQTLAWSCPLAWTPRTWAWWCTPVRARWWHPPRSYSAPLPSRRSSPTARL